MMLGFVKDLLSDFSLYSRKRDDYGLRGISSNAFFCEVPGLDNCPREKVISMQCLHSMSLNSCVLLCVIILIARSLYILNYRNNRVMLYTAFRVWLVCMHARSDGISS